MCQSLLQIHWYKIRHLYLLNYCPVNYINHAHHQNNSEVSLKIQRFIVRSTQML